MDASHKTFNKETISAECLYANYGPNCLQEIVHICSSGYGILPFFLRSVVLDCSAAAERHSTRNKETISSEYFVR